MAHSVKRLLGSFALFSYAAIAQAQTVNYGSLQALVNEPVTSSATGKPQRVSDAPVDIEIITNDQIRRSGATSIPEVLSHINGITVWQATRSFADVGIRGQNTSYNPSLLVLLNGRQVYIDITNYTDWSLIPVQMEEIRQIEIVKGPSTALFGFNAVAGVVNIVTYNPKYDKVAEAGTVIGSGNYKRAYGYDTVALSDSASVRLSGSADGFNEFSKDSKTGYASVGNFENADNQKALADGVIQLSDKTQLRLEASYAHDISTDGFIYVLANPSDKYIASGKATLTSETPIGLVEANLYTNDFHQTLSGKLPGTLTSQLTVFQLQDLFKLNEDHTFRLQGEYRNNTMQGNPSIGPDGQVGYNLFAAGGMWNWAIRPDLEWTNALRLDSLFLGRSGPLPANPVYDSNNAFDQTIVNYSANSGIVWKVDDKDTLRASYGRGIQAPSLIELGIDSHPSNTVYTVGQPALDPAIVHNFEIGYDRILDQINGKLRSSVFYKRTEDINALAGSSLMIGNYTINQSAAFGESATEGIELGVEGKVGAQWAWDLGYTYQATADNFDFASGQTYPVSVKYDDTVPHHVLKAHLGYTQGPWTADAYGEADSDFSALARTTFPGPYHVVQLDGYTTLSGRVAYHFENDVILGLQGAQLTQARVTDNYGLENDRELYVTLSKKF